MDDRSFTEVQDELAVEWQAKYDQAQNDAERGNVLLEFVLERERHRHGLTAPGAERDDLDRRTISILASPEALGPSLARDEAVFRRLAIDPAAASRYLDQSLAERSQQQSERAKKPRPNRRDSITKLIEGFLEDNPGLPAKEVGAMLIDDTDITLLDGEYRHSFDSSTLKEENLASRVSDAKKRLANGDSG